MIELSWVRAGFFRSGAQNKPLDTLAALAPSDPVSSEVKLESEMESAEC